MNPALHKWWRCITASIALCALVAACASSAIPAVPVHEAFHAEAQHDSEFTRPNKDEQDSNKYPYDWPRKAAEVTTSQIKDFNAHRELEAAAKAALLSSTQDRTAILDPVYFPGIKVRLADDAHYDNSILRYTWYKFSAELSGGLSLANIFLVNTIHDPATEHAYNSGIDNVILDNSKGIQSAFEGTDGPAADKVTSAMSGLPQGTLLILLGHVDGANRSFIGGDASGNEVSVSVDTLYAVASAHKINLLILGCQSGDVSSLGTDRPVNSLDVITQLSHTISNTFNYRKTVTYVEFYGALSGSAAFSLKLDILMFEHYGLVQIVSAGGHFTSDMYVLQSSGSSASNGQPPLELVPPWFSEARTRRLTHFGLFIAMAIFGACALVAIYEGYLEQEDPLAPLVLLFPFGIAAFFYLVIAAMLTGSNSIGGVLLLLVAPCITLFFRRNRKLARNWPFWGLAAAGAFLFAGQIMMQSDL